MEKKIINEKKKKTIEKNSRIKSSFKLQLFFYHSYSAREIEAEFTYDYNFILDYKNSN